ncbi:MAG: hypothetical protein AMK75_02980 [Planctomycetes bacterium SM23_65]|nr:MAG: hypothetical protein AMK75_02980 [Planctomycetes bacterium SM23_65]
MGAGENAQGGSQRRTWSFEVDQPGAAPKGWKTATAAATWQVIEDKTAPSGKRALALVRHKRKSNSVRDCCWTDEVRFLDGEISVRFKAVAGDIEKGGGLAWRVRNESTYYNVRTNYGPRGNNIGLYCMVNWNRVWKVYAENVRLSVGDWHVMKVTHHGDNIKVTVNGKKLLDVTHKNSPLASPGGVGVCTKGDAITSFDDLTVTPAVPNAEVAK